MSTKSKKNKYKSKLERDTASWLQRRGIDFEYEKKSYKLRLRISKRNVECDTCGGKDLYYYTWYTPDFFIKDGPVLETKGKWTIIDRQKILAMQEQYPEVDIRMVFQRNNKLIRTSATRYLMYCEQRDIPATLLKGMTKKWITN